MGEASVIPSCSALTRPHLDAVASLGLPSTGKTLLNHSKFGDGQDWSSALEESLGQGVCPAWGRGGFGDTSQLPQCLWEVIEGLGVRPSNGVCSGRIRDHRHKFNLLLTKKILKPVDCLHRLKTQDVLPMPHGLLRLTENNSFIFEDSKVSESHFELVFTSQ